jgi:ethanolamine ammonia-lyase small subunit
MTSESEIWKDLRRLTAARIGLSRSGAALATREMLDFQLAHARARDAVHAPLDPAKLTADLSRFGVPVIAVTSAAADRQTYLMRPDLGRRLNAAAEAALTPYRGDYDVAFVVADGLSACAVQLHAEPVLSGVLPALRHEGITIAPLVIVSHGRVATGDAVATALGAACVVVLIGERPGLSAPDSMGAYLTWRPDAQTTDAERNCISNIRPEGIDYDTAAFRLKHLLQTMRSRKLSGVALKDDSDRLLINR